MEMLDQYFSLQQQIYDYFGYKEDWVVLPLEDKRGMHWFLTDRETALVHSPKPFTEESIEFGKQIYSYEVTAPFLPRYVYRAEDYTLIAIDTRTDGNRLLLIFDNKLECTDQKIKDLYNECW